MNTTQKRFFGGLIAVLLVASIYGAYKYPVSTEVTNLLGGTSPSGATFSSAKFAAVAVNLANPGANGTTTSILNTDSNDRYVSDFKIGCEGLGTSKTAYSGTGLATLQLSIGTTTTAAPTTFLSAAAVALNFTVATGTPNTLTSSSTLATATSTFAAIWPTNTYMTFSFNATNTAACTVGVSYFGS